MRILLDECVHAGLKKAFPDDALRTVPEVGWSGFKNGKLLASIAGRFDVFLTIDQNIRHQQNLADLPFAIIFVSVPDNKIDSYLPLFGVIKDAAHQLRPGKVAIIP
jgi:hypothetical protein